MYIDCEFVECHLGLIIKYSVTVLEREDSQEVYCVRKAERIIE